MSRIDGWPARAKARACRRPPRLQERYGGHEAGGVAWAAEANQKANVDKRVGSRSAFIVPMRAGNRARRDPKEGREAPRGENRWRETREGAWTLQTCPRNDNG